VIVTANRSLAAVIGAGYLLLGVLGLVVTTEFDFAAPVGLLVFGVISLNGLLSVVHIALGAALVGGAVGGLRWARTTNGALGTVLLALGIAGLFLAGTTTNALALNGAGNALHFGSAVVLLAVALGADKAPATGNPSKNVTRP
jgi:hypothetical protein